MTTKLINLQPGKEAVVLKIEGGMGIKRKLQAMGIYVGNQIKVIQSLSRGPIIIESGNTRLAIGRGMAEKMEVQINE